ncbi:MAG: helix-turn-helix domain-containing protein [Salinibacterium sp.]|nr:helix-turn-helix domain-containing protein [Salinibacterium sp.]
MPAHGGSGQWRYGRNRGVVPEDAAAPGAGSQTLSRGLAALALIGESRTPLTINDLAARLGANRSAAYRLVRTLEQHRFVQRSSSGELTLGVRLAAFGQSVSRDLQAAALPELQCVADELQMTAFLVVFDGEEAVTLLSVEPRNAAMFVAQRPGRRHPVGHGSPGRVIQSLLSPEEHPPARYEITHDEVIPGLSAIAVPLRSDRPASIAVLYATRPVDVTRIAAELESAAARITAS